jgi:orotate phosphoribosyltransferase
MTDLLEKVLLDLESMGSIKFGEFTLKSGLKSPVYFDLRLMVSNPTLMKNIAKLLIEVPAFKFSLISF